MDNDELTDAEIIERRRLKRQKLMDQLGETAGLSESLQLSSSNSKVASDIVNVKALSTSTATLENAAQQGKPTQTKPASSSDSDESDDDMFNDGPEVNPAETRKPGSELHASLLDNWDDTEGYYRLIPGEILNSRYKILELLGKGMFATVVRALDNQQGNAGEVAIKIIRNNDSMFNAGLREASLLKRLISRDSDKNNKTTNTPIVMLLETFNHKNHLCLVFESLGGGNLRDVLRKYGRNEGINMNAVKLYAKQLLHGLKLLKEKRVIHGDFKPDNILVSENHSVLKIADLGSAIDLEDDTAITEAPAPYLASRFYRAPELMLGIKPFDYAVDMWALGCTLYEIYTGKLLFTGNSNNKMLKNIIEIRGMLNNKLIRRGTLSEENFTEKYEFIDRQVDRITGKPTTKLLQLPELPQKSIKDSLTAFANDLGGESTSDLKNFIDLLDKMLVVNPSKRITPDEALKHPFLVEPNTPSEHQPRKP